MMPSSQQPFTNSSVDPFAMSPGDAMGTKPQFGLRTMMIAITVFAVLLGLFRSVGIFGALISFLVAVGFSLVLRGRIPIPVFMESGQRMSLLSLIWGVFMPIVCLVFDPFLFHHSALFSNFDFMGPQSTLVSSWTKIELYSFSIPIYCILGYQILMMTTWLLFGYAAGRHTGLFAGSLTLGYGLAVSIAIVLFIPAVFGIVFFGFGLLGFTPCFTAMSYFRAVKEARVRAGRVVERNWRVAFFIGFAIAIVVPLTVGVIFNAVAQSWSG